MASRDGKIVFESTLDARLEVVFRKKLPEVPLAIAFFQYTMSLQPFFSHIMSSCLSLKEKPTQLQRCAFSHLWDHSEWRPLDFFFDRIAL